MQLNMAEKLTLQQVAKKAGVSLDQLSQVECTDSDLTALAEFCDPFNLVGAHLGLTNEQLGAIDGNYRRVEEKRLAVLREWKQSRLEATYELLAIAFLDCNKAKAALAVCRQFSSSHSSSPSENLSSKSNCRCINLCTHV